MNKRVIGWLALILIIGGVVVSFRGNKEPVLVETETEVVAEPTVEGDYTVTLTGDGFSPESILVKKGEVVVWVNESDKTATVNSAVHPVHGEYPPLNLGTFVIGESLSLVFDEVGTFTYHDHFNPIQTGVVVVE